MAEASMPPPELSTNGGAFFKKSLRNKNMRKRATDDTEEEESTSSSGAVVRSSKVFKRNDGRLAFSSGAAQSKQNNRAEVSEDGGPDSEKQGNQAAGTFFFESSRVVQTETDQRATATLETETAFDRDARAIRERVLRQADEALQGNKAAQSSSKVYKGINGYTDHKAGFRREHTIAGEKAGGAHGPLRASAHIRWSVRFDYQPDICKDYKETGYCGYGDSCKFLHDRGDYKSGWQMEKEWDESQKRKKDRTAQGLTDEEDSKANDSDYEDELPFACFICREPFRDPVVTQCKHYFCEHCALKHHSRNKLCFVCNKPTNGVFNTAHEILKKMKEAKAAAEGDMQKQVASP